MVRVQYPSPATGGLCELGGAPNGHDVIGYFRVPQLQCKIKEQYSKHTKTSDDPEWDAVVF